MKKFINSLSLAGGTLLATATKVSASNHIEPIQSGRYFSDVGNLINNLLNMIMAVGALLVFAYLIWGGIEWITSGGDKGKTEAARNKITAAIIGLIVLAASYAIFMLLIRFFGYTDPTDLINKGFTKTE